jgi:predicted DNA binding protein
MAIKIGNNNIAAIFKGNVEIKEIYRGNELVFVSGTEAPTISFVSAQQTTVTISVLNNDPDTLTFVRITHGATTQDFNVSIASNTSGNVVVTGLDISNNYNFVANVDADGKGLSEDSNTLNASTIAVQSPTFSNFSQTQTSITFRVNNPNSIAGTVFYARDADPNTGSASSAIGANGQTGNLSFAGLN